MQVEDERKIVFSAFLVVVFNLMIALVGIVVYALYYAPGNPRPPQRLDVNAVGLVGVFIGIFQVLYLSPIMLFAFQSRRWNLFKGVALGGLLTALSNIAFLLIFPKI